MWYQNSIFYQIYPFGFCGAPDVNDGIQENRIGKIVNWISHMQKIGVNALYLCPIFESDAHGYDTRDYTKVDCRLGSNEKFTDVCQALHEAGIRVVLDAVFNHVGRGFWAFRDVQEKRESSPYKDWFFINFGSNNSYNDGFSYEGWEGHYNLVKLNLDNSQVVDYLFSCIRDWVEQFHIDGLRLDVAYMLKENFLKRLRSFCDSIKPDFFLIGEAIHGDYNRIVNQDMLHSCTNYECFKGIYSSFNERNMFEIAYSLNRQFGTEQWTLYKKLPLLSFVDNHDVNRIASELKDPNHLPAAYAMLFGMPGIPCLYYGSEWGAKGEKIQGNDAALRPDFPEYIENDLTAWIAKLAKIRRENSSLYLGIYRQLYLTNQQLVFEREHDGNRVIVAVNLDNANHTAHLPLRGTLIDLMDDGLISCDGSLELPPYSARFFSNAKQ